jgi:hypothetical protein
MSNRMLAYVNSETALSGVAGNFTYKIDLPTGNTYDRVCVMQASIPMSFYLISANNNTFRLVEIGHTGVVITVDPGNYTNRELVAVLSALFTAASPTLTVYTVALLPTKGKFLFTGAVGAKLVFGLNNLSEVLGFDEGETVTFDGTGSLTSQNVLNFVATSSLFVHSNLTSDNSGMLQEIYLNNSIPYSYVTWVCPSVSGYAKTLSTNSDRVFNFSVCDHLRRGMDFNGLHVLLTLAFFDSQEFQKNNSVTA